MRKGEQEQESVADMSELCTLFSYYTGHLLLPAWHQGHHLRTPDSGWAAEGPDFSRATGPGQEEISDSGRGQESNKQNFCWNAGERVLGGGGSVCGSWGLSPL